MKARATTATTEQREGEAGTLDPEIVALLPEEGEWSEADYLWLTNGTNRLVEFTDGWIMV